MKRFAVILLSGLLAAGCGAVPAFADSGGGSAAPSSTVWDSRSVDVSWYFGHENDSSYVLDSAADLAGAAALVNGLVNVNCTVYTGDRVYTAAEWNSSDYVFSDDSLSSGSNNKSTSLYSYGVTSFKDKTLTLAADLDMSAGNYMPIGGQYRMNVNDKKTHLSSSFCGTFDGGGHSVKIICDRHISDGNFGDGQSVGLIGRLGVHDGDDASLRPETATVKNVAVYGKIYANRSVGGVVGKIGQTGVRSGHENAGGGVIENCANFSDIRNTDSKGIGGIVGAGWNGGIVRNCYNSGTISSSQHACPAGGISGSNEIPLENCYSTGKISAYRSSYAMGIGTNNGGAPVSEITNCYYLEGSAPGGGYYSSSENNEDLARSSEVMKSSDFVSLMGDAFTADTHHINNGYPVLTWQAGLTKSPFVNEDTSDNRDDKNCPSLVFTDLDTGLWYHRAVDYVLTNGYFSGTGATAFEPDAPMTRAMFVTVLSRMDGIDASQYPGSRFYDVSSGQWYAPAVEWASRNGIVNGISGVQFDPDGYVTREQMAAFLYRYANYKKVNTAGADPSKMAAFTDKGSVSSWAADAVTWAAAKGLINGMGDGTLAPGNSSTRAQVAQVIMNYSTEILGVN